MGHVVHKRDTILYYQHIIQVVLDDILWQKILEFLNLATPGVVIRPGLNSLMF